MQIKKLYINNQNWSLLRLTKFINKLSISAVFYYYRDNLISLNFHLSMLKNTAQINNIKNVQYIRRIFQYWKCRIMLSNFNQVSESRKTSSEERTFLTQAISALESKSTLIPRSSKSRPLSRSPIFKSANPMLELETWILKISDLLWALLIQNNLDQKSLIFKSPTPTLDWQTWILVTWIMGDSYLISGSKCSSIPKPK